MLHPPASASEYWDPECVGVPSCGLLGAILLVCLSFTDFVPLQEGGLPHCSRERLSDGVDGIWVPSLFSHLCSSGHFWKPSLPVGQGCPAQDPVNSDPELCVLYRPSE